MTENVAPACRHNQVVSWFQFASAAGHAEMSRLCRDFIKANFEAVADSMDFPTMELDLLMSLVQCNDLVVEDEVRLLRYEIKLELLH
jgi:hypothetical protein